MIIDDDPDILQLLKAGLSKSGFEIEDAENVQVALSKIAQRIPDLIITDAMMPGKDGFELSRELRNSEKTAAIPIIMLTALQQEQDALRAFQEGVDDFITKPFSLPVLRARVSALLHRAEAFKCTTPVLSPLELDKPIETQRTVMGISSLDTALGGGIPRGSNVLIIGETGSGKSHLARQFITRGLQSAERCMAIVLDDEPAHVRESLSSLLSTPVQKYEDDDYFRLVDCFSWNRGTSEFNERFSISGMMELNQLAGLISDAGTEIGQTVHAKLGGRRALDSVSSLFISFELASVQRFLAQTARTATSYGGVSTLFIIEEGAIGIQEVNNIKYLMDVTIELKYSDHFMARVTNMKWSQFNRNWVSIEA